MVALRLFNVFGPRQVPNSQYSGVISIFTNAMQQGLPLIIYGDGTQTRDFIYVKDAASAFAKSLTISLDFSSYIVCNIGNGKSTSLMQLVEILKSCFPQWQSDINFAPDRPGDIKHSQADISSTSEYLGFIPQWSVKSGLKSLIDSLASS